MLKNYPTEVFNPCNTVERKFRLEALEELWPATASAVILIIINVMQQYLHTYCCETLPSRDDLFKRKYKQYKGEASINHPLGL
jgi:hypothetical protein